MNTLVSDLFLVLDLVSKKEKRKNRQLSYATQRIKNGLRQLKQNAKALKGKRNEK